jgi:nitrogen fixation NifU-like protein
MIMRPPNIPDDRQVIADDLYRELILDHYRSPRHRGRVENPDIAVEGKNPLCGDELTLTIGLSKDRASVERVGIEGRGCAISQASGSMMAEALPGRTLEEAGAFAGAFKAVMLEGRDPETLPPELEDCKALENVKQYPVRIKCAILAWNALLQAIREVRHG